MSKRTTKKYLFRGSTINWPGSVSSQSLPRTSVTTNPIKAILFALCCGYTNGYKSDKQIIYIIERSKLKGISTGKNWLAKVEEEIAFEIKPSDYISLCEGYIFAEDAINIILSMRLTIPAIIDDSLFLDALKNTPAMSNVNIEQFYLLAQPFLNKP